MKEPSKSKCPITFVKGKAYDLGNFECRHPGGADLIRLAYENEATALIHSYHKDPGKIFKILSKLEIPHENIPHTTDSFDSEFFRTLKTRVNDYFISSGKSRRGGLLLRTCGLLLASAVFYYLALTFSWVFAGLFGLCMACIGLCIHHDANHGAYSYHAAVNHILGLTGDLIGTSSLIWRYQHCLNHHVHCNDVNRDQDTMAGLPLFRLHLSQPRYRYMRFQHIYTLFLYALMGAISPFSGIYEFIKRKHGEVKLNTVLRKDQLEFWLLKLIYIGYMFIIPFYVLGYAFIWEFYLPVQLIGGLYLGTLFAANHNNSKVQHASTKVTADWAERQVITSANWASGSRFWNIISGGLNCQIEHHLFPGIAHIHYPALHPIIKQTCEEFAIPYNDYPTFREILVDHIGLLRRLALVAPQVPVA